MSTISAVKSWASNEVLTASDLNAEFSNLISAVNNLNSDNLDLTANYTFTGNLQGANVTAATALLPDASGGADIGSTSLEFGDVFLADGKAIKFGSDQDITVTHVADTGLTMAGAHANGTNLQLNNTATDGDAVIQFALSGTVAYSLGVEDGDSDKFVINYGTGALGAQPALEIDSSGNTSLAGTLGTSGAATLASLVCTAGATFGGGTGSSGATITTAGAGTFDGIIKTEDTTEATSTTDGSLQTDGGLSVAKDAIIGDDLKLLSDSAVLSLGADSDATLTHDGTTGVTIAANPITVDSGAALTLDAHTGVFVFKDAGSEVLRFTEGNSGDVTIKLATDGKDLVFTDNGDATNLKVLDAAAGINVPGEVQTTKIAYTDGDDAITIADGGGVTTASTLTIGSVAAAGSDTDKFLVLDGSGNVDYRTGAQVASDIGAVTSVSATAADDIATGDGAVNIVTTSGNITLDAQANDADLIFKVDDGGSAVTALTLDGSDEGNAIFVNDVQLKSDSAVLEFGADLDTTLTHTDGTGLTLNSTNKLTFGDAASFIQQSSDGTLRIDGEAIIDLNASTRVDVSNDLKVDGDIDLEGNMDINGTLETDALTIGGTTILANDTNNRVTTATGSGTLNGEANLTFDGSTLTVTADQHIANGSGLVVGNTAQIATGGVTAEMQVQGTGDADSAVTFARFSADASAANMFFLKSRNGTIGSNTIVQDNDRIGQLIFCADDGSDYVGNAARIWAEIDGTPGNNDLPGALKFGTTADGANGDTERMRIESTGRVEIYANPGGNSILHMVQSNSSTPHGVNLDFSAASPDDESQWAYRFEDSTTVRFIVYSNGDVENHDNSYSGISDSKLKQDVEDARAYWDDFKQIRFRKFKFKSDVEQYGSDAKSRFGVVAQEAESVFPSLVTESPDTEEQQVAVVDADGNVTYEQTEKLDAEGNVELDSNGNAVMANKLDDDGNAIPITQRKLVDLGTTTKGFKYSILNQIGLKVVQELQTRLEAAEAKIAALEAA